MDASIELVKHLLLPVVHIHAVVAREHPSTQILGGDRSGSGLVVDASGLILTVNYIVMGAQSIEVAFAKGRRTRAEIVAQDFEVGLALLKVKRQGLPAAALGDGDALKPRSEEHTSELQSQSNLVCRLLLEKKKKMRTTVSDARSCRRGKVRALRSAAHSMRKLSPHCRPVRPLLQVLRSRD